jgi:hypothetical protein
LLAWSVLGTAAFLGIGGFLAALAGTVLIATVFARSTMPGWSRTAPAAASQSVAVVSIALDQPLDTGARAKDQVLLALTLLLSVITLGTGRTTVF